MKQVPPLEVVGFFFFFFAWVISEAKTVTRRGAWAGLLE